MKPTTLCFVSDENGRILLGKKKRGFGIGKYNGFGGKRQDESGETFRECAVREVFEESALLVDGNALDVVALLEFRFPYAPELSHISYVYTVSTREGIPLETEEMEPCYFSVKELPFAEMWQGDAMWLPKVLSGKKAEGFISFGPDNDSVEEMYFVEVEQVFESEDERRIARHLREITA